MRIKVGAFVIYHLQLYLVMRISGEYFWATSVFTGAERCFTFAEFNQ
jgi:hypothetical protein